MRTGTQLAVQGTGNTNTRRFRLPRTSGLTPSQAEDVTFETRLASYSDDSIGANSGTEERRRSKDDAWVDILLRATRAAQYIKVWRFAVPGALDHATLVVRTQKSRVMEWLRFSQEFVPFTPVRWR